MLHFEGGQQGVNARSASNGSTNAFQRCAHLWALETCTTRPGTVTT